MTNRVMTTLAIRFAALLLFMNLFDQFGNYFISVYYMALMPGNASQSFSSFDKLFSIGTIMMLIHFLITLVLFFKAEGIASRLIRNDSDVNIGLTPEKLIRVILLTTGLIWLATSVFSLPDVYDFIQSLNKKVGQATSSKRSDLNPVHYLIKTTIAFFFVFRVETIGLYLERRMNKGVVKRQEENNNG